MKAVLFDMDGVLCANSDYHIKAWEVYAERFGCTVDPDEFRRRLGQNNRDYMRFILNREPTESEVLRAIDEKEALYREIYRPHLILPQGLLPFLEGLRNAGIACGVATAAPPPNVDFTLDGLGIRHFFKKIVDAHQVERAKPFPDIYLEAARQLHVAPAECLVVEDALAGIQAGNAAGMQVIAITTSYPPEILQQQNPAQIIHSFMEFASPTPVRDWLVQRIPSFQTH